MNKHPDSVYSFESLGPVHSRSYRCTVDIGTKKFVGTFDSSLAKAKELACQKLHDYLVSLSEVRIICLLLYCTNIV